MEEETQTSYYLIYWSFRETVVNLFFYTFYRRRVIIFNTDNFSLGEVLWA
jgi:hypothetical protein